MNVKALTNDMFSILKGGAEFLLDSKGAWLSTYQDYVSDQFIVNNFDILKSATKLFSEQHGFTEVPETVKINEILKVEGFIAFLHASVADSNFMALTINVFLLLPLPLQLDIFFGSNNDKSLDDFRACIYKCLFKYNSKFCQNITRTMGMIAVSMTTLLARTPLDECQSKQIISTVNAVNNELGPETDDARITLGRVDGAVAKKDFLVADLYGYDHMMLLTQLSNAYIALMQKVAPSLFAIIFYCANNFNKLHGLCSAQVYFLYNNISQLIWYQVGDADVDKVMLSKIHSYQIELLGLIKKSDPVSGFIMSSNYHRDLLLAYIASLKGPVNMPVNHPKLFAEIMVEEIIHARHAHCDGAKSLFIPDILLVSRLYSYGSVDLPLEDIEKESKDFLYRNIPLAEVPSKRRQHQELKVKLKKLSASIDQKQLRVVNSKQSFFTERPGLNGSLVGISSAASPGKSHD